MATMNFWGWQNWWMDQARPSDWPTHTLPALSNLGICKPMSEESKPSQISQTCRTLYRCHKQSFWMLLAGSILVFFSSVGSSSESTAKGKGQHLGRVSSALNRWFTVFIPRFIGDSSNGSFHCADRVANRGLKDLYFAEKQLPRRAWPYLGINLLSGKPHEIYV